jgi:hypothetical protein
VITFRCNQNFGNRVGTTTLDKRQITSVIKENEREARKIALDTQIQLLESYLCLLHHTSKTSPLHHKTSRLPNTYHHSPSVTSHESQKKEKKNRYLEIVVCAPRKRTNSLPIYNLDNITNEIHKQ